MNTLNALHQGFEFMLSSLGIKIKRLITLLFRMTHSLACNVSWKSLVSMAVGAAICRRDVWLPTWTDSRRHIANAPTSQYQQNDNFCCPLWFWIICSEVLCDTVQRCLDRLLQTVCSVCLSMSPNTHTQPSPFNLRMNNTCDAKGQSQMFDAATDGANEELRWHLCIARKYVCATALDTS